MLVETPTVDSGAEWFTRIISYLKVKSMAMWFTAHPDSNYECFEDAWPFMLDQMMHNATRVAVEQLQTVCQFSLN